MKKSAFVIILLSFMLMFSSCGGGLETYKEGNIKVPASYDDLIGMNYKEAIELFTKKGFTNVIADNALYSNPKSIGMVYNVFVNNHTMFSKRSKFNSDVEIKIQYYSLPIYHDGDIKILKSSIDYGKMSVETAFDLLTNAGFTNIKKKIIETDDESIDGKVKSINVNGYTEFSEESTFSSNTPISIQYYEIPIYEEGDIKMSKSSSGFKMNKYEDEMYILENLGFSNITLNPVEAEKESDHGKVESVLINDHKFFSKYSSFDASAEVIVNYYYFDKITPPYSSYSMCNKQYRSVVDDLKKAGFTNVTVQPIYDLITGWLTSDGSVEEVTIDGVSSFDEDEYFKRNSDVIVSYHTFSSNKPTVVTGTTYSEGELDIPYGYNDCKGKDYKTLKTKFENYGFTNIKISAIEDLIIGFLTSDGEVEEVTINGHTDFLKDSYFSEDSEIIIYYHTFPGEGSDLIDVEMIDVVGMNLETAFSELKNNGIKEKHISIEYEQTKMDTEKVNRNIIDRYSDKKYWVVTEQSVDAGDIVGDSVILTCDLQTINVNNNDEFSRIMSGDVSVNVSDNFMKNHKGELLEFNGTILMLEDVNSSIIFNIYVVGEDPTGESYTVLFYFDETSYPAMNVGGSSSVSAGMRFHIIGRIDGVDEDKGVELKPFAMEYLGYVS